MLPKHTVAIISDVYLFYHITKSTLINITDISKMFESGILQYPVFQKLQFTGYTMTIY